MNQETGTLITSTIESTQENRYNVQTASQHQNNTTQLTTLDKETFLSYKHIQARNTRNHRQLVY